MNLHSADSDGESVRTEARTDDGAMQWLTPLGARGIDFNEHGRSPTKGARKRTVNAHGARSVPAHTASNIAASAPPTRASCEIELGHSSTGPTMVDVGRLLSTRLLVQAGSGGGKSWLLRRLIEQCHGKVRQIVFDPEGELATLAEQFDFTVCAPDSKTAPIAPCNGASVARTLFHSGRSSIISLSEFDGLEEMQQFVADFCRELLRMPPESWHHVVIAFDEAQLFAPQHDKAVSKKPLIDLARRGRKRGMCPIFATQRLSELSKGVAGQLENKLIGLTTLDLDIARAADMLGLRIADARSRLRRLQGGNFVAFGPALGWDLVETRVGPVKTRHGFLSEFTGVATTPSMTSEALSAQLRGMMPAAVEHAGTETESRNARAKGATRSKSTDNASTHSRGSRGLSREQLVGRAFDVADQLLKGAELAELALEHGVTDQSVRNWLRQALDGVNLPRLGIRGERLRLAALRDRSDTVAAALARARVRALRAARKTR